jgi:hypothetical protein
MKLFRRLKDKLKWTGSPYVPPSFDAIDSISFSKMSDKQLAMFRSQYKPNDPGYILAEYEWQRRLIARQTKSMLWSAVIAAIASLLGVILGFLLSYMFQYKCRY